MDVPDTVTEAVQFLQLEGFVNDFPLDGSGMRCGSCRHVHRPEELTIRYTFRFEGATDPADEAIVLGVVCPKCGAGGTIVSAYGVDADPAYVELIQRLIQ
ncbi:MAG: phosphoribosylpyrophosphate synthetase [Acidimicrobiia bacterium]